MEAKLEEIEAEESGAGILEADFTGVTFGLASRDEIVSPYAALTFVFIILEKAFFLNGPALMFLLVFFWALVIWY